MSKFFIFLLFVLNLVSFSHAMASSFIEQAVVYNDEGKPDGKDGDKKDEEKNPDEEECE